MCLEETVKVLDVTIKSAFCPSRHRTSIERTEDVRFTFCVYWGGQCSKMKGEKNLETYLTLTTQNGTLNTNPSA